MSQTASGPRQGRTATAPAIDPGELSASLDRILHRHPCVGLAVGVVRDGELAFFRGHGLADIESSTPITEDTGFRIASITKTITAIAVLQLVEHGVVQLDHDANDYLRAYRLVPARAGWRAATVRHLLTHTAGVPQIPRPLRALTTAPASGSPLTEGGQSYAAGQPVPTLAEYYRGELGLVTEPGTIFAYGDHSFATLGQIVEDVTGEPLQRYLREHVFDPLGMTDTDLCCSDQAPGRLATGYALTRDGARAVAHRRSVSTGAGAVQSTPRDMARYLAALLGGGANRHGRALEPATVAAMFAPQFRLDPRVAGMGLAFWRGDAGGHLVVEHQGVLPGFDSQILLAPDDGIGLMAFCNGTSGAVMWMPDELPRLLGQVLGVPEPAVRTDLPQRPEVWADICGWYGLSAQWTDMQARSLAGLGAEVVVRRGEPVLRIASPVPALRRGFTLHPDDAADPRVFRIDLGAFGLGSLRVVFGGAMGEPATSIHVDLVPLRLERRPSWQNPRRWVTAGALAAAGVGAAAVLRGRTARS